MAQLEKLLGCFETDALVGAGDQSDGPSCETCSWTRPSRLSTRTGRPSPSDIDDPRFIELTGELSLASSRFRQLWARHEGRGQRGTPIRIDHPQIGELTLNRERLSIGGAESLRLVVYHADAGSRDAEKLSLLASANLPTADARPELQRSDP